MQSDTIDKKIYIIDMNKRIEDDETIVDIEKFRLIPYIKFLLDPKYVNLIILEKRRERLVS